MSRKLRVVITDGAKSEVRSIRDIIGRDRPIAAANWVRDFKRHVRMLATIPLGFEIIPEADEIGSDFRHVLFGNYRIIYHVAPREVAVLGVIHAARKLTQALLNLPHPPEK